MIDGAAAGERWILGALTFAAMLRVFLFSSAFPFFDNIDEYRHADVVFKYANGFLPGSEEVLLDPYVASLIAMWGSPEFLRGPESFPDGKIPSAHGRGLDPRDHARVQQLASYFASGTSIQAHSPPFYYFVAGRAFSAATALGLPGIRALYCVRWLNALAAGCLVALAGWLLRAPYADEAVVRLGVPALIAIYPNDMWYGLADDALLPLLGGAAFLGLIRRGGERRFWPYLATGAAIALAFLTKVTAIGLFGVAGAVTALTMANRAARSGGAWMRWTALWLTAAVPCGLWLLRNRVVVGTWSAQQFKTARMTMESRPISDWIDHPLATPAGWLQFLPRLTSNFWTGEFIWSGKVMTWAWLDEFYVASTAVLLGLAAAAWVSRAQPAPKRRIEGFALFSIGAAVLTLAYLSVSFVAVTFNFINSWSEFPYLASGRYISWILVPLAILLVRGMSFVCTPLPPAWRRAGPWVLLTIFIGVVVTTEAVLTAPVFGSAYNWFHLD